jgi:hypothetical protein
MRNTLSKNLIAFICFMLCCLLAFAQGSGGSLSGRVTDASGAAVPEVRVELENIATGQRITAITGPDGTYTFVNVPVGNYRVITTWKNNSPTAGQQVVVELGRASTYNISMPSGPATDAMVSGEAVPVQTQPSNVQTNFNTRLVHYLASPNFVNRDGTAWGAYNLGLLPEAVLPGNPLENVRGPAVSGSRPLSNNFHIDGIDNNNKAVPGPLVYVSNEATTEFALFHNQPSPMLGHSSGGRFNSVVRTGTNQLHGAIYNYLQNRNFNALPSSLKNLGYTEHPRYDQNRLGASLGVPIVPSKFFFFGNFEYIPLGFTWPSAAGSSAPTAAGFAQLSRMGGVSASNLGILQSAVGNVTEAAGFVNVSGQSIPVGRIAAESRGWQNQFNGTGAGDWTINDKDQLRVRYVHNELEANNSGIGFAAFMIPRRSKSMLASIAHYHTFGDAVTNELRFGYNRFANYPQPGQFGSLGNTSTFPAIGIGGALNLQFGPQLGFNDQAAINTYQLADSIRFRFGGHNLHIGGDVRRYLGYLGNLSAGFGSFAFSDLERFLLDLPPDVASQRAFGNTRFDLGQWLVHGHIQDTWNVTPAFTLNLGLRWQHATVPSALQAQMRNEGALDGIFELDEPIAGWRNFAPHIGISFSPGWDKMTVFRAGFGMHYDALYSSYWYGLTGFNPASGRTVFGNLASNTPGFFARGGLQDPAAGGVDLSDEQLRGLTTAFAGDQRLPYSMQWNAAFEQAIWRNATFQIKYLGSRGVNQPVYEQLNTNPLGVSFTRNLPLFTNRPAQAELNALPLTLNQLQANAGGGGSLGQAGFTSPISTLNWGGNTWYHGASFVLSHRFTGGFQFQGHYTWSRFEDDSTGTFADVGMPRQRYWSVYDRRHTASAVGMFELAPLFRNTPVAAIFADFNINGTYTYQSEGNLPVMSGAFNNNLTGTGTFINPDVTNGLGSGVSPLLNSQGQVVAYLANNPNAQFFAGAPGMFTGQRNYFRTPDNHNFDVAGVKRFTFMERAAFEIRAEAYNLFNTAQFVGRGSTYLGPRWSAMVPGFAPGFLVPGNPEFGNLDTALGNNARMVQLALRLTF